jgi:hypothetical protein
MVEVKPFNTLKCKRNFGNGRRRVEESFCTILRGILVYLYELTTALLLTNVQAVEMIIGFHPAGEHRTRNACHIMIGRREGMPWAVACWRRAVQKSGGDVVKCYSTVLAAQLPRRFQLSQ